MSFFDWLAQTPYVQWVQESWGWPVALTLHAFGTATIVGLMPVSAMPGWVDGVRARRRSRAGLQLVQIRNELLDGFNDGR